MKLANISNFFKTNKKIFYYIGFFAVVFMMSGEGVFAAEGEGGGKTLITFVSWLVTIAGVGTYLLGVFLDPSWMNGGMFGLTEYFKDVWLLVSNAVYFIFAFILIWIAFMNIIGKEGETYQLKQALPKFIVGVLIVPFSWFLVQIILSFTSILAVNALTLPTDTFDKKDTQSNIKVPKECTIDLTSVLSSGSGVSAVTNQTASLPSQNASDYESKVWNCGDGSPDSLIPLSNIIGGDAGVNNSVGGLIAGYTFGILHFEKIGKLFDVDITKGITNQTEAITQLVFNGLFVIIYSILIVTLCFVLIVRGIYLWMYIMLSPLFGLMYFFGKDSGGEGFFSKFNMKEFFALAMVPVYVMLALSFGMLFISVIIYGGTQSGNGAGLKTDFLHIDPGENSEKITLGSDSSEEKISIEIKGFSGLTNVLDGAGNVGNKTFGIIGTLLINILGAVVFWVSIMAALRTSEITKAVVEPIYGFGTKVGGMLASSPQYLPMFGGQSMKSLQQSANSVGGYYQTQSNKKSTDFLSGTRFGDTAKDVAKYDNIKVAIKNAGQANNERALVEQGQKIQAAANGDFKGFYNTSAAKEALFELLKNSKTTVSGVDKASDISHNNVVKIFTALEDQGGVWKDLVSGVDGTSITQDNLAESSNYFAKEGVDKDLTKRIKPEYKSETDKKRIYTVDGTRVEVKVDGGKQSIDEQDSIQTLAKLIQGGMGEDTFKKDILDNIGIKDDAEIKDILSKVAKNLFRDDKGNLGIVKTETFKNEVNVSEIWKTN